MPPFIDLAGKRVGRLSVVSLAATLTADGRFKWRCVCDCGHKLEVDARSLRSAHTQSCGCLRRDSAGKHMRVSHGHTRKSAGRASPEYLTWKSMIQRCLNPNATGYDRYGACGITVCERWLSFENFLADMGPRPADCTLDRYPNKHGNYEPDNCRWATDSQQSNNKRTRSEITTERLL